MQYDPLINIIAKYFDSCQPAQTFFHFQALKATFYLVLMKLNKIFCLDNISYKCTIGLFLVKKVDHLVKS